MKTALFWLFMLACVPLYALGFFAYVVHRALQAGASMGQDFVGWVFK